MGRASLGWVFAVVSMVPFVMFAGCGDDDAAGGDAGIVSPTPDGSTTSNREGGSIVIDPETDSGTPRCAPVSSAAPPVPTASLAGSVGDAPFPSAPKSWARPIASLRGFYEVDISEGEASCTNVDGGTRGVRLIVAGDGSSCSAFEPARAEFYRKTGVAYARPAATEGVLKAKAAGSALEVGVVIGKFGDPGLPADGLTGTTKVPICP